MQAEQIPALHAADVQLSSQSELQLSEQDSLDVASSEWSQTKSARRKQKRKGNSNYLKPLEAAPAAFVSREHDNASQNASGDSTQDDGVSKGNQSTLPVSSAVADTAFSNASDGQHTKKKLVPRPASPLGKKRFGGFKGQTAGRDEKHQRQQEAAVAALQPLTRQRQTKPDADDLILVSKQHANYV